MMTMAINGSQVLLLVKNGATYEAVGEQTSLSVEESANLIEANYKGATFSQAIYGRREGTITLEALYVPTDSAFAALRNAMKNRSSVFVRRKENGAEVEQCECLIDTMSMEFPDNEASTISVDLMMISEWTTNLT
jgi:hypothetical protein